MQYLQIAYDALFKAFAAALLVAPLVIVLAIFSPVIMVMVNFFTLARRRLLSLALLENIRALTRLGLPLVKGLNEGAMGSALTGASIEEIGQVGDGLLHGMLVGDAMARVPYRTEGFWGFLGAIRRRLPPYTAHQLINPAEAEVLRVGEMSGDLPRALDMVLRERRRAGALRTWLYASFLYPVAVLVVAGGVVLGVCTFIVPKFKRMFEEMDVSLPAMTDTLVAFSRHAGIAFLGFVALVVGGLLLIDWLHFWRRPPVRGHLTIGQSARRMLHMVPPVHGGAGANFFQRAIYLVPFAHGGMRRAQLAECCRELAMLMRAGVPPHRALRLLAEGTLNPWLRDRLARAAELCDKGLPLSTALDESRLDRRIAWFARGMSEGGALADALERLGEDYAAHGAWRLAVLGRLVPPLLILVIGASVGYIVIALFLPLIKIMSSIGG